MPEKQKSLFIWSGEALAAFPSQLRNESMISFRVSEKVCPIGQLKSSWGNRCVYTNFALVGEGGGKKEDLKPGT